jgi:hypothetical protein
VFDTTVIITIGSLLIVLGLLIVAIADYNMVSSIDRQVDYIIEELPLMGFAPLRCPY